MLIQKSPITQLKYWYVKTWIIPLVSDYSSRVGNEWGRTVLLVLKPLVVDWLIAIEKEKEQYNGKMCRYQNWQRENTYCADVWLMVASQLIMQKMYKSWQWIRNDLSSCFEAPCSRLIDCNWKIILQSKMCRYQNLQRENTYCADVWLIVKIVIQNFLHKIY